MRLAYTSDTARIQYSRGHQSQQNPSRPRTHTPTKMTCARGVRRIAGIGRRDSPRLLMPLLFGADLDAKATEAALASRSIFRFHFAANLPQDSLAAKSSIRIVMLSIIPSCSTALGITLPHNQYEALHHSSQLSVCTLIGSTTSISSSI